MEARTIAQPALTAAQADELSQRQVKKHDVAIMLLHWFNALVWLLELTTGAALLTSSSLRIVPLWFVQIVQGFFVTKADLLRFHIAVGIAWIVIFAAYAAFGFRTYVRKEVLRREISLDGDDIRWLRIRLLRMLKRTSKPLPPQGIYNAGQKLFAIMVYAMVPLIMASGLVMTFHLLATSVVGWAAVVHFAAVGAVLSGLMVHAYMAAVFPEEKPAFFSMITGNVNELYAFRHHFKWWSEVRGERGRLQFTGQNAVSPEHNGVASDVEK
ncbi:MAG: cytochrome b/b6 domain-containing protein [Terriglobales bacterium]